MYLKPWGNVIVGCKCLYYCACVCIHGLGGSKRVAGIGKLTHDLHVNVYSLMCKMQVFRCGIRDIANPATLK